MKLLKPLFLSLLFVIGFAFVPPSDKDDVQLEWKDWNTGYPKSMETEKIALIDMYTDWCGWCKRMDKDTYANEEVIEMINENFVPIKFNPEKENVKYNIGDQEVSGRELQAALSQNNRTGYPATFFLNPKTNTVYIERGYKKPGDFKKILKKYVDISEGKEVE